MYFVICIPYYEISKSIVKHWCAIKFFVSFVNMIKCMEHLLLSIITHRQNTAFHSNVCNTEYNYYYYLLLSSGSVVFCCLGFSMFSSDLDNQFPAFGVMGGSNSLFGGGG